MHMIAAFFAPYLMRIAIGAAVAAFAGASWITVAVHYENKGYAKAIAAVAAKDKGAIDGVREAKARVDECYGSGRAWNVTDGVCE
jgi:hypothetical protein